MAHFTRNALRQKSCPNAPCNQWTILPDTRRMKTSRLAAASGATFMFGQAGEEGCPASGSGIESPNASHQFGDRIFQANQLFVLENLRQPMRAVIHNLGGQCQG